MPPVQCTAVQYRLVSVTSCRVSGTLLARAYTLVTTERSRCIPTVAHIWRTARAYRYDTYKGMDDWEHVLAGLLAPRTSAEIIRRAKELGLLPRGAASSDDDDDGIGRRVQCYDDDEARDFAGGIGVNSR